MIKSRTYISLVVVVVIIEEEEEEGIFLVKDAVLSESCEEYTWPE